MSEKSENANFEHLIDESQSESSNLSSLENILNIPVTIAMEIGRTKITIKELLNLNKGAVVELDKISTEPLDIRTYALTACP